MVLYNLRPPTSGDIQEDLRASWWRVRRSHFRIGSSGADHHARSVPICAPTPATSVLLFMAPTWWRMALVSPAFSAVPSVLRRPSQSNPRVRSAISAVFCIACVCHASCAAGVDRRFVVSAINSGWLGDEGIVMMASSLGDFVSRISLSAGVSGDTRILPGCRHP